MADFIRIPSSDYIKVNISNSKSDNVSFERKFPKSITLLQLKEKLEIITGGSVGTMQLDLYNGDKLICKLDDNSALVGSYPIDDGMRIHVTDNFIFIADHVEKFELTEDQYDKKPDTLKNFLKTNRLGKYNEEEMKELAEKKKLAAEEENLKASFCTIGSRCKVTVKAKPIRLGTIMYNGELDGKNGIFIGIKYDEPLGTNDGSCGGKRYFDCDPNYGGFVPPTAVEVGDFPPDELGLDEEI